MIEGMTIGEFNTYNKGKKETEEEIFRLLQILDELPKIDNLSKWYNFNSISVTQMNLEQFIRAKIDGFHTL